MGYKGVPGWNGTRSFRSCWYLWLGSRRGQGHPALDLFETWRLAGHDSLNAPPHFVITTEKSGLSHFGPRTTCFNSSKTLPGSTTRNIAGQTKSQSKNTSAFQQAGLLEGTSRDGSLLSGSRDIYNRQELLSRWKRVQSLLVCLMVHQKFLPPQWTDPTGPSLYSF